MTHLSRPDTDVTNHLRSIRQTASSDLENDNEPIESISESYRTFHHAVLTMLMDLNDSYKMMMFTVI